jgi:hypothetical protein
VRGVLYWRFKRPGNVTTGLTIGRKTWMTDAPPFVWSLQSFAEQSRGKVLVAGLGLGLVVHYLVKNPEVSEIVVIERSADVIHLIEPHLPEDPRLRIVLDDFYAFMASDDQRRDVVIWDLAVWSPSVKEPLGFREMLCMPAWVLLRYGPETRLFRHGIDRDPEGEKFVAEHPEILEQMEPFAHGRRTHGKR